MNFNDCLRASQRMPLIDYALLGQAQALYSQAGFEEIQVPWTVPLSTSNLTKPIAKDEDDFFKHGMHRGLELVGSAEQGFLYLIENEKLTSGRYQAISPCFRSEESFDETHFPWFMKLELCVVLREHQESWREELESVICHAEQTMRALGVFADRVQIKPIQIDLEYKGMELGSYGIRRFDQYMIVYGTGLALPRFSQALALSSQTSIAQAMI